MNRKPVQPSAPEPWRGQWDFLITIEAGLR